MMTILSNYLIKLFLSSLIFLQIFPPLASAGFAELASKNKEVKSGRAVINIDSHWKFHRGAQSTGEHFSALTYNDSSWERVSLPHTWNAVDGTDGGNDYYRGDGWYRKALTIPEGFRGKAVFLKFEAANKQAEVFVNGKSIYTHTGGYTSFTVNLTNKVKYGQTNLIAVRVNNERDDAIPLSGDFTFYGGIYRGVKLLVMDKTHIDARMTAQMVYIYIFQIKSQLRQRQMSP
jgi:beta-galactosidase